MKGFVNFLIAQAEAGPSPALARLTPADSASSARRKLNPASIHAARAYAHGRYAAAPTAQPRINRFA